MNRNRMLVFAVAVVAAISLLDVSPDHFVAAQSRGRTKASMKRSAAKAAPKTNLPTGAEKTKVEIAPVKAELRDQALKSAAKIDSLVEAGLKKAGQKPNEMASPEHFVRRAYLDITGTIPTAKQTSAFITSRGDTKRYVLATPNLNSAQRYQVFEGNARRVFSRLDARLKAQGK